MTGAGSLLTRGLGSSGLLITRGLSASASIEIVIPFRPRVLLKRGSSKEEYVIRTMFVCARLVGINGSDLVMPPEGSLRVSYDELKSIKVFTALPKVAKRRCRVLATVRVVH